MMAFTSQRRKRVGRKAPSGSYGSTFLVLPPEWLASCIPMRVFLANNTADWLRPPAVPE